MQPDPHRARPFLLPLIVAIACLLLPPTHADSELAHPKPVLLYSLHFNALGENRYAPDGTYSEVLHRLAQDFQVRVSSAPLTDKLLSEVQVLLISNPNEKAFRTNPPPAHISGSDIRRLRRFVRRGGGLFLLENQEGHNLEIEHSNQLLAQFGLQATNRFTDAKLLRLPPDAPIVGGLRWAYYTGDLLLLNPAHPARPEPVVLNDLTQKPALGQRDQPGVLMARVQSGSGRLVVSTDAGWIANWALNEQGVGGVSLKGQDNWEIFHRLVRWLAHLPPTSARTTAP